MNTKITKPFPAQKDFFICDIADIEPRGDIGSMEHPIFSLSNRDLEPREYINGKDWLKIFPSELGLATIFDRDVLIFCISQGVAALNDGRELHDEMRFTAYDLLTATNRNTQGGSGYVSLNNALDRLAGTRVKTNIKNGGAVITKSFSLLSEYEIIRKNSDGRMLEIKVILPRWIMDAIRSKHILKFNPDYFTLRSPLHRKFYEIMRKHCGIQPHWKVKMSNLQLKMGAKGRLTDFKRIIVKSETDNNAQNFMPDYLFFVDGNNQSDPVIDVIPKKQALDDLKRKNKKAKFLATGKQLQVLNLKPETIEAAKKYAFHGDVYALEAEWRDWAQTLPDKIKDPNALFIAFCKKKCAEHQKRLSANAVK